MKLFFEIAEPVDTEAFEVRQRDFDSLVID